MSRESRLLSSSFFYLTIYYFTIWGAKVQRKERKTKFICFLLLIVVKSDLEKENNLYLCNIKNFYLLKQNV